MKSAKQNKIRNFSIIAHIDHGKSTLADRIMEMTNAVAKRDMREQLLDDMALERERGITIKLKTVHMQYQADDGEIYELNLIDTPGHADFNYEVSRSLAACEGALLVIDATQGMQAQTIANLRLAQEQHLTIIPVINKIDMPSADIDKVMAQLDELENIDSTLAILTSARTGEGVKDVLESIVKNIPSPQGKTESALQALIFDSHYDPYRGIILNVRVVNGCIKPGMQVRMLATKQRFQVTDVGYYTPERQESEELAAGEVGFVSTGLKDAAKSKVGDTLAVTETTEALHGYKEVQPMVFAGLFTVDNKDEAKLRDAVEKLALNDSAFVYTPETSQALGAGFRCGFLGVLHMEIVQERLEREFHLQVLSTAPSVSYHVMQKNGTMLVVNNPSDYPSFDQIDYVEEPFVNASIILPVENIGDVIELCNSKRGIYQNIEYLNADTAELAYELPMAEIVYNFYDALKSLTHGYATIEYVAGEYRKSDLVKMEIWLNDDPVDAFNFILPREDAFARGKNIVGQMKYLIPRKLYPMPVQAVVENHAIAREDIPPLRKSATGRGFSGSIGRKRKAAKNIAQNRSRQRKIGKADVPQEAFHAILNLN